MKLFRNFGALFAGLASALLPFAQVSAQTQPTQNPTYTPAAILAPVTLTAAGAVVFNINNVGTVYLRVAGTYTGLAAVIQGTEQRTTPTWTTLSSQPINGAARLGAISANGLYRVNTAGFAQIRVSVTAISTGSVTITGSGGAGVDYITNIGSRLATYSASTSALSPAASATDFITLAGGAGVAVRVLEAVCDGTATAIGVKSVVALKRSTANTAGTSTAPTIVPHDSGNPTAVGTPLVYTANPTTGTLVGNIETANLQLNTTATSTYGANRIRFAFGTGMGMQEVILRGATETFALNGAGASFPAGAAINCRVTWTEE